MEEWPGREWNFMVVEGRAGVSRLKPVLEPHPVPVEISDPETQVRVLHVDRDADALRVRGHHVGKERHPVPT